MPPPRSPTPAHSKHPEPPTLPPPVGRPRSLQALQASRWCMGGWVWICLGPITAAHRATLHQAKAKVRKGGGWFLTGSMPS